MHCASGDLIDRCPVSIEVEEGIHVCAGVEGSAQVACIHVSRCAGWDVGGDRSAHFDFDRRITGKGGCRRSKGVAQIDDFALH